MHLRRVILTLILVEVATKCFVKGLQCYVCENCTENEDFKELHICGEIPNETLMQFTTALSGATKETTTERTDDSSSKSPSKPTIDDYLYEDSGENQTSIQKKTTKTTTTKTTTTVGATTLKPTSVQDNSLTESSTTLTGKPTAGATRTTQNFVTNSQQKITKASMAESKTTTTTTATRTTPIAVVTSTKSKPELIPDYDDDYIDYEDRLPMDDRSALLKINEPVCYMIKYKANNSVFTNRGCTTFINGNKFLTCQSLHNGAPMESCRVCYTNGCNKFLDDDGGQENHELLYNSAYALKHFGVLILSLWILLFSCEVI